MAKYQVFIKIYIFKKLRVRSWTPIDIDAEVFKQKTK